MPPQAGRFVSCIRRLSTKLWTSSISMEVLFRSESEAKPLQWIFLLGVATGSRTMTAVAVLCWAAWLGTLPEHGWAIWSAYLVSALIFTGMALGEYYGDTLPSTPSRKDTFPALSRVAFGALAGALAATAIYQPLAGGILDGALGALVGTWAGYAGYRRS